jgi:hypothetical protein
MTLKKYLFLMILATIICWGAWALILFFVNPKTAGVLGIAIFYVALFLGLAGVFSIVGFIIRYLTIKQEFAYRHVKTAFRQGLMFAFLLVVCLFLQSQGLLVWWNGLLLIILLGGVEYVFISMKAEEEGKN